MKKDTLIDEGLIAELTPLSERAINAIQGIAKGTVLLAGFSFLSCMLLIYNFGKMIKNGLADSLLIQPSFQSLYVVVFGMSLVLGLFSVIALIRFGIYASKIKTNNRQSNDLSKMLGSLHLFFIFTSLDMGSWLLFSAISKGIDFLPNL